MAQARITVNQADLKRIQSKLKGLKEAPKTLTREIQQFAKETAEVIRKDAPVRSGRLRDSIDVDITAKGAQVTSDAPYAASVEYGTRFRRADPFFFRNIKIGKLLGKLKSRLKQITK